DQVDRHAGTGCPDEPRLPADGVDDATDSHGTSRCEPHRRCNEGSQRRGGRRRRVGRREISFEVALFRRVWAQRGGFLLSADLGKMVMRKWIIRQPLKKEPPVLIMQDALPLFKSFLKPVSLKHRGRQLVLRCVIAFLMHLGKMSASRVAGAIRTDARHRAQVSRFLGRRYW